MIISKENNQNNYLFCIWNCIFHSILNLYLKSLRLFYSIHLVFCIQNTFFRNILCSPVYERACLTAMRLCLFASLERLWYMKNEVNSIYVCRTIYGWCVHVLARIFARPFFYGMCRRRCREEPRILATKEPQ